MCKECEEHRHFVCECEKEFKNQKAISGHQANCDIHLKLLEEEREKRRLPNGLFKCENPDCPNEHDGSYGTGRFCSEHCRRVYIGKHAFKTKLTNGTFRSPFSEGKHKVQPAPIGTWKCRLCGEIFRTRYDLREHRYKIHQYDKSHAWNYGLTKETDKIVASSAKKLKEGYSSGKLIPVFKGRHHSIKTRKKISEIQKENFKKGIIKGWTSRKIVSFPESFWKRVLDNNSITYQFQLKVTHKSLGMSSHSCYFIDFALPGKVDLEIDGSQHRFREEEDKKRTENLERNGWTVYRIKWNDVRSTNGKLEMKDKIDHFLQWYKNFCDVHLC